jgi:hypothetical protein
MSDETRKVVDAVANLVTDEKMAKEVVGSVKTKLEPGVYMMSVSGDGTQTIDARIDEIPIFDFLGFPVLMGRIIEVNSKSRALAGIIHKFQPLGSRPIGMPNAPAWATAPQGTPVPITDNGITLKGPTYGDIMGTSQTPIMVADKSLHQPEPKL